MDGWKDVWGGVGVGVYLLDGGRGLLWVNRYFHIRRCDIFVLLMLLVRTFHWMRGGFRVYTELDLIRTDGKDWGRELEGEGAGRRESWKKRKSELIATGRGTCFTLSGKPQTFLEPAGNIVY